MSRQRIVLRIVINATIGEIMKILDKNVLDKLEIDDEESRRLQKIKTANFISDFELFVNHLEVGGEVNRLADALQVAEKQRRRIARDAAFLPVIELVLEEEEERGGEADKQPNHEAHANSSTHQTKLKSISLSALSFFASHHHHMRKKSRSVCGR